MSEREKKNHWINEFDQNKSKHRTMIIGDKSAADTQNLPAINHLLKPMNILFPSCVKIKPWEFSDQKFQWSVSPLMRSAVSVVSLRTADDPWKKQQEALHVHHHMGGSLHGLLGSGLAHYGGKVALQRAELNGSLKKV